MTISMMRELAITWKNLKIFLYKKWTPQNSRVNSSNAYEYIQLCRYNFGCVNLFKDLRRRRGGNKNSKTDLQPKGDWRTFTKRARCLSQASQRKIKKAARPSATGRR